MSVDSPTDERPAADPPAADDGDRSERADRSGRAGRLVVAVVVGLLLAMWGYVLYLAFGPGRQPSPDRLEDPAFAEAAEDRCAAARADLEALPLANESPTAAERADVLDQANATLTTMLDDLAADADLAPAGEPREAVEEWLADWRTYLGDRQDYATALRRDPDARLLVSEKPGEGRHVTVWIDEFAAANHMSSCATPGDV